jgi:[ribosomal protein S5]-alanine N-acetyltransferase
MDPPGASDWVEATGERWTAETDAEWAIVAGDDVLGRVARRGVDLSVGHAEISYWTRPHARGRGVASDGVSRIATWALRTVGFWRLEIRHSVQNPGSCRVAVHAGFIEEAQLARHHLHADGFHDIHIHSRLQPPPAD